jgi:hypothetical protein
MWSFPEGVSPVRMRARGAAEVLVDGMRDHLMKAGKSGIEAEPTAPTTSGRVPAGERTPSRDRPTDDGRMDV